MERPIRNPERPNLRPKLRQIQSTWSPDQRRRRAATGRRRLNELYRLITREEEEIEIWAVGAPALDDMSRLAS